LQEVIKGKSLEKESIDELLNLTSNSINKELLARYFAFTAKDKPKFSPQDYFVLPKDKLYNKEAETTTVGRYIFNLLILNDKIGPIVGYTNKPITGSVINSINNKIANSFVENKIGPDDEREFIDKVTWLGFSTARYMNASLSAEFVMTHPKISKKKEELIKKNAKEIENGDMTVAAEMENELIKDAKEIFKDNPAMQIYDSGCRGSFGNNYKNTSIMRGTMKDFVDPSKSYISTSNLDEGIKPEEFEHYCNLSITGTYGRAIETQDKL